MHISITIVFTTIALGFTLAHAQPCDFENPDDHFCTSMGMEWINQGGQPTITSSINHTPGGTWSLYNNFNGPIAYSGPPVQSLWIVSWTLSPASTVTFEGIVTVELVPFVWQEVELGGATSFQMTPTRPNVQNFGTFAIDDLNFAVVGECLADVNSDGMLNFFDVSAFLSAFTAGDLSVDFTGDGVLNFFDVSAFLSVFADGCP